MTGLVNIDGSTHVGTIKIRTPDGRWIPIPLGAGEDAKLRSLNIYDGTQWQTATWAKHAIEWELPTTQRWYGASIPYDSDIPSLEVRAPGLDRSQTGGINPNSIINGGTPLWKPANPNYFRITHTYPKVDPTWRIIQLFDLHPIKPPSQVNWNGFSAIFWALGGQRAFTDQNGSTSMSAYAIGGEMIPQYYGVNHSDVELASFTYYRAPAAHQRITTTTSTTIDLKTIRQRLIDDFPERNIDFQAQYDPISDQTVKRICISVRADMILSYVVRVGNFSWFSQPRLRIYAAKNAATSPVDPYNPQWGIDGYTTKTYAPRVTDSLEPTGELIYEHTGTDPGSTYPFNPWPNDANYVSAGAAHNFYLTREFDVDDDDTLTFYCVLDNYYGGPADESNILEVHVQGGLYVDQNSAVSVQYASAGHDVPLIKRDASYRG